MTMHIYGPFLAWISGSAIAISLLALVAFFLGCYWIFKPPWFRPRADGKTRILFYDGECGLCTHSVKLFLKADSGECLKFAPLQGTTAKEHLPEDLRNPEELSTVVFMRTGPEGTDPKILTRSLAIANAFIDIGGLWRIAGWILHAIPPFIREPLYRQIAKHRRKLFPSGACSLPTKEEHARLLE